MSYKTCTYSMILTKQFYELPSSSTRTRSLSITVGIRWATVITVQLLVSFLIVFWMTLSVAVSTEAVASSNTNIFRFWSSTLARHTSCLCPTLQFSPSSATVPKSCKLKKQLLANHILNLTFEFFMFYYFILPGASSCLWSCLTPSASWHLFKTWKSSNAF